jgi:ClpP class serine protease
MFDLSDHIFANRDIKPIIAIVDDMAYSATYGIGSAADEVILSRTGGVGSVGVVSYHIDQSDHNKKQGIKVEYLFAGDRKVDGNPHVPLADTARESIQDEINRLYDLFVTTVARNRGMSEQAVRDTQAGTYHGEQAIEVGFADKIGTFGATIKGLLNPSDNTASDTLLAAESAKVAKLEEVTSEEAMSDDVDDVDDSAESEDTLPQVDASTNEQNTINAKSEQDKVASPTLSVAEQAEIKAMCAAAAMPDVANDYITASTHPSQVRADLFAAVTAGEQEINTAEPVHAAATEKKQVTASTVYAQRNKRGK